MRYAPEFSNFKGRGPISLAEDGDILDFRNVALSVTITLSCRTEMTQNEDGACCIFRRTYIMLVAIIHSLYSSLLRLGPPESPAKLNLHFEIGQFLGRTRTNKHCKLAKNKLKSFLEPFRHLHSVENVFPEG